MDINSEIQKIKENQRNTSKTLEKLNNTKLRPENPEKLSDLKI